MTVSPEAERQRIQICRRAADALAWRKQTMKPPRKIRCPACKKEGDWFDAPFGPFCSRRCKLVDLGKWFSEENLISEPLRPDHSLEGEESSSNDGPLREG